jgi:hypothetical protein
VQQNLMFGLNAVATDKKALADHYAAVVGLTGFEKGYPHELSGGMLKRVELARALVVKPEILTWTEPLAALDALTSLQMRIELLRILAEERHTCVLITHDVEEAIHMADRIIVLSPRPATIQAAFEVPFPQPRNLLSPRTGAVEGGEYFASSDCEFRRLRSRRLLSRRWRTGDAKASRPVGLFQRFCTIGRGSSAALARPLSAVRSHPAVARILPGSRHLPWRRRKLERLARAVAGRVRIDRPVIGVLAFVDLAVRGRYRPAAAAKATAMFAAIRNGDAMISPESVC